MKKAPHVAIGGVSLRDLSATEENTLWRRGGFPREHLASSEKDSIAWRKNFINTMLERDLLPWGVRVPAVALQRFWTMLAHYAKSDLILRRGHRLLAVECKCTDAPRITPSLRSQQMPSGSSTHLRENRKREARLGNRRSIW